MKSIAILLLLILFSVHVAGQDTTNINKVQQTDIADSLEILNKMALQCNFTEDYANALKIGKRLEKLTLAEYGKYSQQYVIVLGNLAYYHGWLGHVDTAIEYFKICADIKRKLYGEAHIEYASTIGCLSFYLTEAERYTEAIPLIHRALEIFQDNHIQKGNDYFQTMLAAIHIATETEEYQKGIAIGNSLLKALNADTIQNTNRISNTLFELSKCFSGLDDYPTAIKYNKESLSIMLTHSHRLIEELEQMEALAEAYYLNEEDTAFIQTKKEEHRLLKDILINQLSSLNNSDRIEYSNAAYNFYQDLINVVWLIKEAQRKTDVRNLKQIIYEGCLLLKNLILNTEQSKLARRDIADITNYQISLQEIKNHLSTNDVAIEFIDYPDWSYEDEAINYAAVILKKDWEAPVLIRFSSEMLLKRDMQKMQEGDSLSVNMQHAYNHIWKAIVQNILSIGNHVYFSANGILHQIPIESLPVGNGKIMSDLYHMHRLSSTRELALKKEPIRYKKAVLYGGLNYDMTDNDMKAESSKYQKRDSTNIYFTSRGLLEDSIRGHKWIQLGNTLQEVEYIKDLLEKNYITTNIYKGNSGNEEAFKALSGQEYNIIHLATHGFFYPDEVAKKKNYFKPVLMQDGQSISPIDMSLERSGLVLSGGNRAWKGDSIPEEIEDGILKSQEIKDLDLRGADLVVLSACHTGQGEVTNEGVFGLQRAFKMAGVQTIVMSLTEVDDQTTMAMMNKFYANLLSGQSKHDAFYNTQRYIRSIKPNPIYWAGWIMLD